MPATRIARSCIAFPALLAACVGSTYAGVTPVNTWLGAADGDWNDASRWSLGAPPPTDVNAAFPDLLFNASGSPFTVTNHPTPLLGYVNNVLVDTPDITLDLTSRLAVLGLFDLRRGILRLDGSVEASDVRIGTHATFIGENAADSTFYGRVVNEGRIDLSGNHRLRIDTRQSGAIPTLVNEGTIALTAHDSGAPRIVVDQLLNHGVIELTREPDAANAAALTTQYILNTGEIVADHAFAVQSDLANAGVIRLHNAGSVTFVDNTTTVLGEGRITGGDVYVGVTGSGRDTLFYGPLRADANVFLRDRARLFGGVTTAGAIDIAGEHIDVEGGLFANGNVTVTGDAIRLEGALSSNGVLRLSNLSQQTLGQVSAQSLHIDASTVDFGAPVLVTGLTTLSGSEVSFRGPSSQTGTLELIGADLTVGAEAPGGAATLHVDGDLTARSSATLRNFRSAVTVDGDLDWNAAAGSRIETPLDVTGDALIRNAHIQTSINATRATLGGVISGNPTLIVTDGPVLMQAGIVQLGNEGARGRFTVQGDLRLGTGLLSRVEIDLIADANGILSHDYFEITHGDAILNAVLDLRLTGDAASLLQQGDSFTILTADTVTGEFLQFLQPSLSGGLFFDVVYEPSAVRLVVVPTPGVVSLFALAGLATTRRARRDSLTA